MPYDVTDSAWAQMPESVKKSVQQSYQAYTSTHNPYLVGPGGMPTQAALATIPQAVLNTMLPKPVPDVPKLAPTPTPTPIPPTPAAAQSAYTVDKWQQQIDAIKQKLAQSEGNYNWDVANLKMNVWNNAAGYGNTRGSYNGYALAQGMRPLNQGLQSARDAAAQDIEAVNQAKAVANSTQAYTQTQKEKDLNTLLNPPDYTKSTGVAEALHYMQGSPAAAQIQQYYQDQSAYEQAAAYARLSGLS